MNTDTKQVGSIEVIPLIFFLQEVEKAPGPSTWDVPFIRQNLEGMKISFEELEPTGSVVNWKGDKVEKDIVNIIQMSNGVNEFSFGVFDGIGDNYITKEPGVIGLDMLLGIYYLLTGSALNIDDMLPEDKSDTANIEFDKIFSSIVESIRGVLRELNLLEDSEKSQETEEQETE